MFSLQSCRINHFQVAHVVLVLECELHWAKNFIDLNLRILMSAFNNVNDMGLVFLDHLVEQPARYDILHLKLQGLEFFDVLLNVGDCVVLLYHWQSSCSETDTWSLFGTHR